MMNMNKEEDNCPCKYLKDYDIEDERNNGLVEDFDESHNMNFDLDLGVIANNCDQSVKYGNSFQDFQKNSNLDFEIMLNDQGDTDRVAIMVDRSSRETRKEGGEYFTVSQKEEEQY
ncbi:hypothetical protein D5086_026003 [Populus alba]|uniref:Uncharacterized protein n=1 Tax=Populus alba TaxID=43335 RepID=A0ACC4B0P3_POPAL